MRLNGKAIRQCMALLYHWCTDWESVQNPLYADYTGEKSVELLNVFYDTLEKFDLSYGKPYSQLF